MDPPNPPHPEGTNKNVRAALISCLARTVEKSPFTEARPPCFGRGFSAGAPLT